jgi:cytoplasmic tRNA 2-thiolation protein 1
VLRGDIARLERCVAITTGENGVLPRCKPFKYTYEKEIVLYAHYKKLDYFSTECIYSPMAYRGYAREFLKDLESVKSSSIIDIIESGEHFSADRSQSGFKEQVLQKCNLCGYMSSNSICKACVLLDGLNSGSPSRGIGRTRRSKKAAVEISLED